LQAAAAARDDTWAATVHAFIHDKVLGFNPNYSGQLINAHTAFQDLVEEAVDALLPGLDMGQEELVLALIGTTADDVRVPPAHRACALEILSLDSMDAFETLLRDEARAAKEDCVRKAGLAALATPEWLEATAAFVDEHAPEFLPSGGSQLSWTQRHEDYQEACEALLEDVLAKAGLEPTDALQALCQPSPSAPGVTPLPPHACLPLRAFVDYKAFERMMVEGM